MSALALHVLALVASTAVAASAAEPAPPDPLPALSLVELLRAATQASPLVSAARHDIEAADAERQAMRGHMLPTIGASMLAGPTPTAHGDPTTTSTPVNDYGYVIDHLGPFFRAELSITQPLYTFGKVSLAEQALHELVDVRRAQATTAKWEVVTQVKSVYYGLLLVGDLVALTDEVQGYVDQAKTYLEQRLASDGGDVTPIDRAKLATYEAELKTQRIDLVRRRATLNDALRRLAGLAARGSISLAERELVPVHAPKLDEAAVLEGAASTHSELGAAAAGVRALAARRDAVRARLWPDLFVAGRARYGVAPNRDRQTSPFAKDDFNFFDAGVAVGLRYDWPTGVTGAEIALADAQLAALEDKRQALAERVAHDVAAALDDWRAAGDKLEATKEGYKASRTWSVFARNGFELGTVSARDLIDALGAFVKVRFAFSTLTFEYNVAVARLSQTAGHEVIPELAAGVW